MFGDDPVLVGPVVVLRKFGMLYHEIVDLLCQHLVIPYMAIHLDRQYMSLLQFYSLAFLVLDHLLDVRLKTRECTGSRYRLDPVNSHGLWYQMMITFLVQKLKLDNIWNVHIKVQQVVVFDYDHETARPRHINLFSFWLLTQSYQTVVDTNHICVFCVLAYILSILIFDVHWMRNLILITWGCVFTCIHRRIFGYFFQTNWLVVRATVIVFIFWICRSVLQVRWCDWRGDGNISVPSVWSF